MSALDFARGALSGTMTFVMPEKKLNGDPLPASVAYTVTLDGETYATGDAAPARQWL